MLSKRLAAQVAIHERAASKTSRNVIKKSKTVVRDLSVNQREVLDKMRTINISKLDTDIEP